MSLPTADGVGVKVGDVVYWKYSDYKLFPGVHFVVINGFSAARAPGWGIGSEPLGECYSTKEAAIAAQPVSEPNTEEER